MPRVTPAAMGRIRQNRPEETSRIEALFGQGGDEPRIGFHRSGLVGVEDLDDYSDEVHTGAGMTRTR